MGYHGVAKDLFQLAKADAHRREAATVPCLYRNVDRIKAGLTAKINAATYTIVIVGQYANAPHPKQNLIGFKNWINFEIAQSKSARNKIVAVKLDRTYESPDELMGSGASWAMAFTEDAILRALSEA